MRQAYKGTAFLLIAQIGRLLFQAGSLFLVARYLGAENMGAIAVLLALASVMRPLSGFGYQVLVIQDVARDPRKMPLFLSQSIPVFTAGSSILGLTIIFALVPWLKLELSLAPTMMLVLSELFFGGLFYFLCCSWQAEENFLAQSRCYLIHPMVRFLFILVLVLTGKLSLLAFTVAHGLSLLCMVIPCFILRFRSWGRPGAVNGSEMLANARRGFPFAVGVLSLLLMPEIDKILMPRLSSLAEAGQYALGIKVVTFAALPFTALLFTFLPRFFREGADSSSPGLALTKSAWKLTVPYSLLTGGLLALFANLPVKLLGDEYLLFPDIIRYGVGLLVLQAIHLPAGDALNGAGEAKWRASAQIVAAIVVAAIAYGSIPSLGWRGALLGAYAGHSILVVLLIARLFTLTNNIDSRK